MHSTGQQGVTLDSLRSRLMENETLEETVADEALVEDELLIEEISIDGMCGVY